jgi:hypothetical protein
MKNTIATSVWFDFVLTQLHPHNAFIDLVELLVRTSDVDWLAQCLHDHSN